MYFGAQMNLQASENVIGPIFMISLYKRKYSKTKVCIWKPG